jgi:hypothetical protein
MNPDLYNDEFRHFKYLKNSLKFIEYWNKRREQSRSILNDCQSRVEFLEQILDLENDTLYYVMVGVSVWDYLNRNLPRLYEIKKPLLYQGVPFPIPDGRKVGDEDIWNIENRVDLSEEYYLISKKHFRKPFEDIHCIFRATFLPVIPDENDTEYSSFFYNEDDAKRYLEMAKRLFL